MKEVLLLAIVSFLSLSLLSQPIVNIENLRHSGELGVFKSIGLSLNSSRGNEERDDYKLDLSFAKNNDRYESLITFNNSKRTKDELLEDKSSFLHARFLKKLERSFDVETYIQSSKNPFQSYKKRNLAGVGIRLNSKRDYKFGLSVMREIEESLLGENISTNRLNLYINKKILLNGANGNNLKNVNLEISHHFGIENFYKFMFMTKSIKQCFCKGIIPLRWNSE